MKIYEVYGRYNYGTTVSLGFYETLKGAKKRVKDSKWHKNDKGFWTCSNLCHLPTWGHDWDEICIRRIYVSP